MTIVIQVSNLETAMEDSEVELMAEQARIKIRVIGCGGGGSNTVTSLKRSGLEGVGIIAINTDASHLRTETDAHAKILIGEKVTRGYGAGNDPEKGKEAAMDTQELLKKATSNADIIFLVATLGGGTGTGSAPVVARLARENKAMVFSFVTLPFKEEGEAKMMNAKNWLPYLAENSDTIIIIPNEKLKSLSTENNLQKSFEITNRFIMEEITGLVKTINERSHINIDFEDLRKVLSKSKSAYIAIGESAGGENRIDFAIEKALSNPLIEVDIRKAKGCLMRIIGGDIKMKEFDRALTKIHEMMDEDCEIIAGIENKEQMGSNIKIFFVFTGVDSPYIIGSGDRANSKIFGDDEDGIDFIQ